MTAGMDLAIGEYRSKARAPGLDAFRVTLKESDLQIACRGCHQVEAFDALRHHRELLEDYIRAEPAFLKSLTPVPVHPRAPVVVRAMAAAASACGVGPMAAVAGALAECVGRHLLGFSRDVIIENGGDVFCRVASERVIAIDAGTSPLSWMLGIKVTRAMGPTGICTSSGTRGESLSFGRADAACAVASTGALADAAATAIGNVVQAASDIETGLAVARAISGLRGAVIVVGAHIGAWGNIELVEIGA